MTEKTKRQLGILAIFLSMYAILIFITYSFIPIEKLLPPGQSMPEAAAGMPVWVLGLIAAGAMFLMYGLLGLGGYFFAGKLGIPPVFRERAGWKSWLLLPMVLGLGCGIVVVVIDRVFALARSGEGLMHPGFPISLVASATAGIGEEILFRGFFMGLWAFLANLVLKRWNKTGAALWIGNGIAALAFSAGHLPSAMVLMGASSPMDIPLPVLIEGLLLNSFVGLIAGERYIRDGLVAAMGVHFWADIVWHVIWPLFGTGM
ncbi:MAG: CPBP family intramembrane metalloprotease [Spirochaetales bacterium]|nr:CPBP family intramembrane metalloprotease [Spirochaetales bacterium]